MRKILISLLLAGAAATPALAGPNDQNDRQQTREERQQARQERQQARQESRGERPAERPSFNTRSSEAPQAQSRPQFVGNPNAGDRAATREAARAERMEARSDRGNFSGRGQGQASDNVAPGPRVVTLPSSRESRGARIVQIQQDRQDRADARALRQSSRALPNVMRTRNPLVVSNTPRPGTQPPLRTENRRTPEIRWATNWRNNSRYDWRNYRHHHRSHFHLGFYFDPFGWGYQPYSIGWRLWPAYYGSRYWINDPWSYRLPYAPPGYRWIRYWNDALLVDTWTGEVVDVIPNFFW